MQVDLTQLINIKEVIDFINEVVTKGFPINGKVSITDEVAFKSMIIAGINTYIYH